MCVLSLDKLASSADASRATPITCDLPKVAPSRAKPVMSSPCPYAGDIIVNSIVTAKKLGGGIGSDSIQPARHALCGSKRTRTQHSRGDGHFLTGSAVGCWSCAGSTTRPKATKVWL
jgi:hypothetical protein